MSIERTGRDPEGDLSALERRLGNWRPAAGVVDRDRMLFEAGRAAARNESWGRFGGLSSAFLALVALGLGGLLVREQGNRRALEATVAAQYPRTGASRAGRASGRRAQARQLLRSHAGNARRWSG